MSALQEQNQDLPGAHALRGEVALPRTCFDEYRRENVHQKIWGKRPIGFMPAGFRLWNEGYERESLLLFLIIPWASQEA